MKKLVPILIVLCVYSTFCSPSDTKTSREGRRTLLLRLSTQPEWSQCEAPECTQHPLLWKWNCKTIATREEAVEIVATYKDCIDEAIAVLAKQPAGPAALNDLAVAYYVRAKRTGRYSDLLSAFDEAERAAPPHAPLPAALFNQALLLEEMGLSEDAVAVWNAFLAIDRTAWSTEARRRRDRLEALSATGAVRWLENRRSLRAALASGGLDVVRELIRPSIAGAQEYLENALLVEWSHTGDPALLVEARLLARAISDLTKDPYPLDIVRAIESSRDAEALRTAHHLLSQARDPGNAGTAQRLLNDAARAFRVAGSPLYFQVLIDGARLDEKNALQTLDRVEAEMPREYARMRAYARAMRGYILTSNPMRAIEPYTDAIGLYPKADRAGIAGVYARRGGVYSLAGAPELALKDAFAAMRLSPWIHDAQRLHAVYGETGGIVMDAGHASIALRFQTHIVERLTAELSFAEPAARLTVGRNLHIALRARSLIHAELEHHEAAEADFNESIRLTTEPDDSTEAYRRMLAASASAARGRFALKESRPAVAVSHFTDALAGVPAGTIEAAQLLAQRAEAKRLAQLDPEDIKRDMEEAVAIFESEQQQRADSQDYYGTGSAIAKSVRVSRLQETYRRLVQLHDDTGDPKAAFDLVERRRARELDDVLRAFDATDVRTARPATLASLQSALPVETVLLEYEVLPEQTYCWMISKERFEVIHLDIGRDRLQAWLETVQTEARRDERRADTSSVDRVLTQAYDALLAKPLKQVASGNSPLPRLVIVPGGPMHGLPMHALRNARTGRYLIEDAVVEVGPSVALYMHSLRRDRELSSKLPPTALLVGDPLFDDDTDLTRSLKRLPGARSEVEGIAQTYGSRAETLLHEEATIEAFLERAQTKTVVHFAGHAIVNAERPENSMLLLAESPRSSGALYARDLMKQLKLDRTKLVVLAACSSAAGQPIGAEGVGPLVRPLIAARVPAVVGSLWPVDDATAQTVFVSFHQRLREGKDAAVAMQIAQVEAIRREGPKGVFRWAPYQVIGHATSPFGAAQK